MFCNTRAFNRPLTKWVSELIPEIRSLWTCRSTKLFQVTSSATDFTGMFFLSTEFNQSVNHFVVDQATNFSHMFRDARSFNQPLTSWRVSSAQNMSHFAFHAENFQQDLCHFGEDWPLNSSTSGYSVRNMFTGTSCWSQDDPDLSKSPVGPFCFDCKGNLPTLHPTTKPASNTTVTSWPSVMPSWAPSARPSVPPMSWPSR